MGQVHTCRLRPLGTGTVLQQQSPGGGDGREVHGRRRVEDSIATCTSLANLHLVVEIGPVRGGPDEDMGIARNR